MWGVVAGRGGVGCVCGVGMPLWLCLVGAAAGVSLFLVGRFAARIVACRAAVCLSVAACSVACCWFVAVCVVCRLLHVVRFVSVPASGVTWFMSVCVGMRLTATVIVVYRLLCNGRFQWLALSTGMPVVFVSVSHRHKGWWGESGARGWWRLAARRTT